MAVESTSTLGRSFAESLARKDFDGVMELLAAEIDFKALTPRRGWEASSPRAVVDDALCKWFGDDVELERLVSVEAGSVGDRERVAYRLHGHNDDGPFVLEQQVYYGQKDGSIDWMRVLCSGFRPR
jgi:hypothetical protein